MAIGDLWWPQEICNGHRRYPMAIRNLVLPYEISYGNRIFPAALGDVLYDSVPSPYKSEEISLPVLISKQSLNVLEVDFECLLK